MFRIPMIWAAALAVCGFSPIAHAKSLTFGVGLGNAHGTPGNRVMIVRASYKSAPLELGKSGQNAPQGS
jgi:hypothetical protein